MDRPTLPVQMIEPERRRIRGMKRGESGYVLFTAVKANARGECLLHTGDWLRERSGMSCFQVSRDEEGLHLVVPSDFKVLRLSIGDRLAFLFS